MLDKRFTAGEIKIEGEQGRVIAGYASTFETPENHDSYGDIIAPGAFRETLASGRRLKMLDHHGRPVGVWTEAKEDARGLFVRGRVSNTRDGDDLLTLIKDGVVEGLSIGFSQRGSRSEDLAEHKTPWGAPVRRWLSVNAREASPVWAPANESATITEVKAQLAALQKGRRLASRLEDAIDAQVDEDTSRADVVERMGRAAGISAGTVNQILNGSINCPPLTRLRGFARALGVSLNTLVNAAEADGCDYGDARAAEFEHTRTERNATLEAATVAEARIASHYYGAAIDRLAEILEA